MCSTSSQFDKVLDSWLKLDVPADMGGAKKEENKSIEAKSRNQN
jgi:hypothetical protein